MVLFTVNNVSKNTCLGTKIRLADTFLLRLRGCSAPENWTEEKGCCCAHVRWSTGLACVLPSRLSTSTGMAG